MMNKELFCELCNISFQRREHCERHLRTHTKEKPFTCSECQQSFGRVDSLSRHYASIHQSGHKQGSEDRQNNVERRRVARACKRCSVSKIRCDGLRPCRRCDQYGHECHYEATVKRKFLGTASADADMILVEPSKRPRSDEPEGLREPEPLKSTETQMREVSEAEMHPEPTIMMDSTIDHCLPGLGDIDCDFLQTPGLTFTASTFSFGEGFDIGNWMNEEPDTPLLSSLLQPDLPLDVFNEVWPPLLEPSKQALASSPYFIAPAAPAPAPLGGAAVAELYSRSHSPAIDKDAVEPRQYVPTAMELDAPLILRAFDQETIEEIEQEDLAHVQEVPEEVVLKAQELLVYRDQPSHYPAFLDLSIPPASVLNVWVQLYFEHLHPVFPILHQPSFSASRTHWLLVLSVAAIGARFSSVRQVQSRVGALQELIRRHASRLCERENKNGRELWMVQVIILQQLGFMYSCERRALEVAEILQSLLPTLGRRKRLFNNMFSLQKIQQLPLPLNQKWQIWILDEERRRAGFAIWLVDSAFENHFDLSTVMNTSELQLALPQSEARWAVSSAPSWASFPVTSELCGNSTLEQVAVDNSWKATWQQTGTIGKQVLIRHLARILSDKSQHRSSPSFSNSEQLAAKGTLLTLLASVTGEKELIGQSSAEFKAAVAHEIMIHAALMAHYTPSRHVSSTVLKAIYNRMEPELWEHTAQQWTADRANGRLALFHAARILHMVRSERCAHFVAPVSLFRAALVLWLYAALVRQCGAEGFVLGAPARPVVLGRKAFDDGDDGGWVEGGWGGVKLPGIGNLLCARGRCKMLDDATALMMGMRGWGISATYAHILRRLRASEGSGGAEASS